MAWFASFFALCVIALGAFTRLIDAGLGCPDWPGCYGHLAVPTSNVAIVGANLQFPATPFVAYKAWAEMIHRYFVGALSLLILGIVITVFAQKKTRTRGNVLLAFSLILLLIYQIRLGQWTVTLKLWPVIVTQHLLGGFFILSVLWMIYLNNPAHRVVANKPCVRSGGLIGAVIALILLLLQISVGAWTSTNYASFSCPDFPFCRNDEILVMHFKQAFQFFSPVGVNYTGGVLPEVVRQTIQMTHRFGALIFTGYILIFIALALPRIKRSLPLMKTVYLILGLLMLQLCLGIVNVLFKLPLATALAHTLVAALLLLAIITWVFQMQHYQDQASL